MTFMILLVIALISLEIWDIHVTEDRDEREHN